MHNPSCRSPAGLDCDGERNLCGEGNDVINQQQKLSGSWERAGHLKWSGRFYWELCATFRKDLGSEKQEESLQGVGGAEQVKSSSENQEETS